MADQKVPKFRYERTCALVHGEKQDTVRAVCDRLGVSITFLTSTRRDGVFEYRRRSFVIQFKALIRDSKVEPFGNKFLFVPLENKPFASWCLKGRTLEDLADRSIDDLRGGRRQRLTRKLEDANEHIISAFAHWRWGPAIDADRDVENLVTLCDREAYMEHIDDGA